MPLRTPGPWLLRAWTGTRSMPSSVTRSPTTSSGACGAVRRRSSRPCSPRARAARRRPRSAAHRHDRHRRVGRAADARRAWRHSPRAPSRVAPRPRAAPRPTTPGPLVPRPSWSPDQTVTHTCPTPRRPPGWVVTWASTPTSVVGGARGRRAGCRPAPGPPAGAAGPPAMPRVSTLAGGHAGGRGQNGRGILGGRRRRRRQAVEGSSPAVPVAQLERPRSPRRSRMRRWSARTLRAGRRLSKGTACLTAVVTSALTPCHFLCVLSLRRSHCRRSRPRHA